MHYAHKSPRWLPLTVFALAAALGVTGCTDDALGGADGLSDEDDYGEATGGDEGESDGDDGDESESEGTEGESEETGEEEAGRSDPVLPTQACDPAAAHVLDYDLAEANLEVAPALIRDWVLGGEAKVPRLPLSPQPFLNYVDFGYPAAMGDDPQIVGELWQPAKGNAEQIERYRLQFAVRGPALDPINLGDPDERPPLDLAVVVDVGPSMAGHPFELANEALMAIEATLQVGDRVSLIAAGMEPVILTQGLVIENGVDIELGPLTGVLEGEVADEGSADVAGALELAYAIVAPDWEGQGQARVVLLSAGHFAVEPVIVDAIAEWAAGGHYLTTVGLGAPADYVDGAIRQLARVGRGPSLFVSDPEVIWQELSTGFANHMVAMNTDVEVRLRLPPGLARVERETAEPGVPPVGAPTQAMLGSNETLVFHHELEVCGELDPEDSIGVEVRYSYPGSDDVFETSWSWPLAELGSGSVQTRKGAAVVAYAHAMVAYRDAEVGPPTEDYGVVLDALSWIAEALEHAPEDPDLIEMSQVLAKLDQG